MKLSVIATTVLLAALAAGCENPMSPETHAIRPSGATVMLTASAAETIVTPAIKDTHVYGDLYARALVLDDGHEPMLIMSVDSGGMSEHEMVAILQRAIHAATGIRPERQMINTSHTHNCPWPGYDGLGKTENVWLPDEQVSTAEGEILFDEWFDEAGQAFAAKRHPFIRWYLGRLVEVVKQAAENMQPATLHVGRAPVQIAYNRWVENPDGSKYMAPNPEGDFVPWVDVLGVKAADGDWLAVLFAYAAHPVIVHYANSPLKPDGSISYIARDVGPDFPGFAVKNLHRLLGNDDGVFMFAQACGADINGYPLRGGIHAADAAGLSLAFAVEQALQTSEVIPPAPLTDVSVVLEGAPLPDHISPYPLRAFAMGDEFAIMCTPRETFSGYQLFADETSPFACTMVLGYTNGTGGYVETRTDYEAHIQEAITKLLSELKDQR